MEKLNKLSSFIKKHKSQFLITFLVLFSITLVISPIYFYWQHFRVHLNCPVSDNPTNWGVFGDFLGGTINPLLAFLNIGVTVYLAYAVNKLAGKHAKEQVEAQKQVVKIQLRHEAVKEFKNEFDTEFNRAPVFADTHNMDYSSCRQLLNNFKINNSYIFDFDKISSFTKLMDELFKPYGISDANPILAKTAFYSELSKCILAQPTTQS